MIKDIMDLFRDFHDNKADLFRDFHDKKLVSTIEQY
jgi:hypothetical protein